MRLFPHQTLKFPAAALLALALLLSFAPVRAASSGKASKIRVAMSESIFEGLNENDSHAALKAWSDVMAASGQVTIDGQAELLTSEKIARAITAHQIDAFAITMPEYAKLARFCDPVVFMDEGHIKNPIQYLLLVRRDTGINGVFSLRGRDLMVYENATMALAPAWLELQLAAANLEASEHFFGHVSKSNKVAQTVLPVFFGRAAACVVTRQAFDTMCELNPQLRQKLQILAVSPKVFATAIGVHKDCPDELKARVHDVILGMFDGPSGRQILTLFQAKRLIAIDSSVYRSSLDLLAAYDRLKAQRAAKR